MRATPPVSGAGANGDDHSFAPHLLASRLRPPQPLLELVRRDRLLQQLSTSTTPLIVVSAPGGFGKTVALAQWAESDQRPFAWLQVDEADNDPLVFLSYLVSALGGVTHIDPLVANWLQLAPPPVETRILPALAAAVAAAAPFVFVVDDAHLITSEACWQVLGVLIEQLPPGAHLCLSGRSLPPLSLARQRAAGGLLEIGPSDLAMSLREIHDLLLLHGLPADAETVADLERVTEGWAAGLYLAALAGTGVLTADWLAGIHGHQHDIAGYLASEVLEQQPPELAAFLLQTSILERLSPSLCRAVTGDKDAGRFLLAVAHNNLFVSALDDADEWFRYHHLFGEFLQAELLRRDEALAAALHARAAGWFEEHGELEEAVRHWLAAGDAGRAGTIVCRAHMHYAHLARYETLRRWLDMFTDEQILADEALTLAAGWIGPMAGDSPRGRGWISAACRIRVSDGMWPGAPVPLRAMQAGLIAAHAEGITQMRENAELAIALSEDSPPSERAAIAVFLGCAHWLGGDSEAALRILREAEDEGAVGNVLAQNAAAGYQALILADEGRWAEARRLNLAGLQRFEEAGLTWGLPTFPTLVAQARLEAHEGDPELAERVATIATTVAQGNIPTYLTLLAAVLVGELLLECGDLAAATYWMHDGFAHLASMPDAGILRPRLLRLRDDIEAQRLRQPLTRAEHRVLELLPTELSQKEIAVRLFVSPETVRTHVRDIYRKLEVHSRSAAVARARELGLLHTS